MKIRLTEEDNDYMLKSTTQKPSLPIQESAKLIGKITATLPAIYQAPLWYWELQHFPQESGLSTVSIIQWCWAKRLCWSWNGGPPRWTWWTGRVCWPRCVHAGLGSSLQDVCTGGLWWEAKWENHINNLELLAGMAAMFVVKAFTKDQEDAHVHLRVENKMAVFYVNRMGELVPQQWVGWLSSSLERNLSLSAEYLPGVDNCIADKESRSIQSSQSDNCTKRHSNR